MKKTCKYNFSSFNKWYNIKNYSITTGYCLQGGETK